MSRCKLRILTQNLWHGLDHTNPYVMWPKENVLAKWLRSKSQKAALKECLLPATDPTAQADKIPESTLEVFCLQEVNPIERKMFDLQTELGMQGRFAAVNVGVRAGKVSYPLFLQEGLGILWRGDLTEVHDERRILSGYAPEVTVPIVKMPLAFQVAERRGAMLVSGEWAGKQFTFVNLHLHNGSAAQPEHAARRAREVDLLMDWMEPWVNRSDAVFIAGDFNCEHGDAGLSPLRTAGFEEVLTARGEPIITWDPEKNPIAKAAIASLTDRDEIEWDSRPHQIDHIFYRAKGSSWGQRSDSKPPWTFRVERILDRPSLGVWPSDHFGLLVEISWSQDAGGV